MSSTVTKDRTAGLSALLDSARRITIVTHTRPDGDAIGSCVAMSSYLRDTLSKDDVMVVLPDSVPDSLAFIPDSTDEGRILSHDRQPELCDGRIACSDLIIGLDISGFERTDSLKGSLRASTASKVLVDHHLNPCTDEFDLLFSETEISSTCELLYWLLLSTAGIDGEAGRIPSHALDALMAGMTTDTNNFANSVFPSTLQMASELLAAGVDRDRCLYELYNRYRENRLRMIGYALKDKLTILDNGAAYIVLKAAELASFDIREGELEGLVNLPLGIDSVRMSILLKEDDGFFRVSIRSKKGTSANAMARTFFNGGGHEQASGGRLYFPRDIAGPSCAEDYVEDAASRFFKI